MNNNSLEKIFNEVNFRENRKYLARFIDQKTKVDNLKTIASCIIDLGKNEFSYSDILESEILHNTATAIYHKPSPFNSASQNEYDKFIGHPINTFKYSGLIKKNDSTHYKIIHKEILNQIGNNEIFSFKFLISFIYYIISQISLREDFDHFINLSKNFQAKNEDLTRLKEAFKYKIHTLTPVKNSTEPPRIFVNYLNPLCAKENCFGASRGRLSKTIINYETIKYNQVNFIFENKPKNMPRKQWITKLSQEVESYSDQYSILERKCKKEVTDYHNSISEVKDQLSHAKATHSHHIFPKFDYPKYAAIKENLITLTPGQHLERAHPDGKTNLIDPNYQILCLKSKLKSIKKSYESYDGFYNYSNFINMINSSFDKNLEPKIMPTKNDYVQCEEALSNLMYEN